MRILVYGDSNTFGVGPMPTLDSDPLIPKGARWVDLLANGLPEAEVIVEALPGRTTVHDDPIEGPHRNGLRILPAIIESHRPIDLLVFMLGTNDLKMRFGLGAQDVALGVRCLAQAALASGHVARQLVVCPPPPFPAGALREMFAGADTRGAGLAAHYEEIASQVGAAFFDAGSVIACDALDGVHFDQAAHAALGQGMLAKVKEIAQ